MLVLRVGTGVMAKCGAGAGRERAGVVELGILTARTGAGGRMVQVGELNTAFRDTSYNLCFLLLAPACPRN